MNICVYGASSKTIDKKYINAVESLGEEMANRGHGLVFGGGNAGAMGAAARGAYKGKAFILGIAPKFFDADGILFPNCSEFIYTDTMRHRKKLLDEKSDAFIITPGGVGTYDEFFEILTLKQLGRHNKPIAVFNVDGYYNPLIALMEKAEKEDFLNHATNELYRIFDNITDILDYIESYDEPVYDLMHYKDVANNLKK